MEEWTITEYERPQNVFTKVKAEREIFYLDR